MFKLPSAGTEPGTLDSARKAMMPSIAKRPLLISVRNLESDESTHQETRGAQPRLTAPAASAVYVQKKASADSIQSWKTPHL